MAKGKAPDHPQSQGVWYCCGKANALPGHEYVYSGAMATYCMWHRPMAIHALEVDRTFFVFGNPDNSPTISSYDHKAEAFAAPVVLGTNPDGDAHRNPTLLIDEDGFLTVFFGAHSHPTRVVRSASPYDISTWSQVAEIEDKNSYPQPWQLRSGEIFVSYRGADAYSGSAGWIYRRSRDGAASWDEPVIFVKFEGCSIYAITIAENGLYPRKVHIAWSRLGGGTPEEVEQKHLWARRYNVYYACSDDGGTTWRRSDGSAYDLPISEDNAEKIYDCGQHGVWLKDIQLDANGNPCILFLDAEIETFETAWKFARCMAGEWRISDITTSDHMYDAGGLVILADDDFRIYGPTTASQPQEDGGEIEEWTSHDGGGTWTNTKHLTEGSQYSHNQVRTVFNHQAGPGDFRVIWCYGDSNFPPETRDVFMYYYGEALGEPRRVAFP